jgi:hypothetical protein
MEVLKHNFALLHKHSGLEGHFERTTLVFYFTFNVALKPLRYSWIGTSLLGLLDSRLQHIGTAANVIRQRRTPLIYAICTTSV